MNNEKLNLDSFHKINYENFEIPIGQKIALTGKTNTVGVKDLKTRYTYKFNRIVKLADKLKKIKTKLEKILNTSKDEYDKECSFAILTMIDTGIRVGNEFSANGYICKVKNHKLYEKEIKTYGLTTLLKEHIIFSKNKVNLNFIGKKGVTQNIEINNKYLIKWTEYFISNNKNKLLSINKLDLKRFIEENIGKIYTIKDFRTLKACLAAGFIANVISKRPEIKNYREFSKEVKEICVNVSDMLGNTPTICRTAYINPDIFTWLALKRFPEWIKIEKEKETKREKAKKLKEQKELKEQKKISKNLKTK